MLRMWTQVIIKVVIKICSASGKKSRSTSGHVVIKSRSTSGHVVIKSRSASGHKNSSPSGRKNSQYKWL